MAGWRIFCGGRFRAFSISLRVSPFAPALAMARDEVMEKGEKKMLPSFFAKCLYRSSAKALLPFAIRRNQTWVGLSSFAGAEEAMNSKASRGRDQRFRTDGASEED